MLSLGGSFVLKGPHIEEIPACPYIRALLAKAVSRGMPLATALQNQHSIKESVGQSDEASYILIKLIFFKLLMISNL